jgi:hypothetical protein
MRYAHDVSCDAALAIMWLAQNPQVAWRAVVGEEARRGERLGIGYWVLDNLSQGCSFFGGDDRRGADALALELQSEREPCDDFVTVAADVGEGALVNGERFFFRRIGDRTSADRDSIACEEAAIIENIVNAIDSHSEQNYTIESVRDALLLFTG